MLQPIPRKYLSVTCAHGGIGVCGRLTELFSLIWPGWSWGNYISQTLVIPHQQPPQTSPLRQWELYHQEARADSMHLTVPLWKFPRAQKTWYRKERWPIPLSAKGTGIEFKTHSVLITQHLPPTILSSSFLWQSLVHWSIIWEFNCRRVMGQVLFLMGSLGEGLADLWLGGSRVRWGKQSDYGWLARYFTSFMFWGSRELFS